MSSANQRRRLRPQHRSVRRHIGYSSHDSSSYRFSPDICLSLSSSLRQSLLHGLSATSLPGGGIRLETHLRSGGEEVDVTKHVNNFDFVRVSSGSVSISEHLVRTFNAGTHDDSQFHVFRWSTDSHTARPVTAPELRGESSVMFPQSAEQHYMLTALSLLLGPYPVALGPSLSWGLPKHKGFYGAMSSAAVAGGVGNPILLKVLSH
ncbi:unnamed protein product [Pleuronectes platessa]|uniref:Uncharacterized protein n=1 Tax=Pleuronectes platessa TaxID=8262 RepID=A0A9N7U5Y2_PLEPL|nr:unnamed protein product [Pleuronectes platessa]